MRRGLFNFVMFAVGLILQPALAVFAAPLDLDDVQPDEPLEQLCDRVAADPFAGFGPDEWGKPFQGIDPYRAIPACSQAIETHPGERRFELELALAYLAGGKKDDAKKLLDELIAGGNTSAMLALAYISSESEAANLMHRAAQQGDANAMMLYGMSEMDGKGVANNQIDGIRMIRRAADAGSTRAMLILANFYKDGSYGIGFNPEEAARLISEAAKRGDPIAQNILAGQD